MPHYMPHPTPHTCHTPHALTPVQKASGYPTPTYRRPQSTTRRICSPPTSPVQYAAPKMFYFGIDQSLTSTGVAVITDEKPARTAYVGRIATKKLRGVLRLAFIRDGLREALRTFPGTVLAALEGYSMGSGGRWYDLGEVGGLVRLTLHDAGIPTVIVPPTTLKLFVAGDGAADKDAMRQAVLDKWGQDIPQDDECDAYGLAQLARSFHLNTGTTRAELEVIKKLKAPVKDNFLSATLPKDK